MTHEDFMTRLGGHLGLNDVEFEYDDFNRRFRVKCNEQKFAFALLDGEMMQWLLDPTGFDLVLCRNVLIYFKESDRGTVLRRLASSATPGYLGLGATELLAGMSSVGAGWYALAAGKRGAVQ